MKNILEKITNKYFFSTVFIVFCFIKSMPFLLKGTSWISVLFTIYGILIFIYRLIIHDRMFFKKRMIIPYIIVFSAFLSPIVNKAFFDYANIRTILMFVITFIVLFQEYYSNTNLTELNKFLFITNNIFLVFTLLSYIYSIFFVYSNRPFGINNDYITFSQIAYLSIGMSLYLFSCNINSKYKILQFTIFIIQFITLILIQQRAAYISFFVGVISFFLVAKIIRIDVFNYINKYRFHIVVLSVLIIMIFVFVTLITNYNFSTIIEKLLTMSSSGRLTILECGFRTMEYKKTYLFGSSSSLLPIHWSEYIDTHSDWFIANLSDSDYIERLCREAATHSSFFQQLFAHGLFGFIPLCIFYISNIFCLFKNACNNTLNNNKSLMCLLAYAVPAIMISSILDNDMFFNMVFPINVLFFVFAGVLFNLKCYIK